MSNDVSWNGSLTIGDYAARWTGAVGVSRPHRHFAAQAILSDEPIVVTCGERTVEGAVILIEPNTRHCHSSSARAELHFLEPNAPPGVAEDLRRRLDAGSPVLVSDEFAVPFWAAWLQRAGRAAIDVRIAERVGRFDELIERGPVRLSDLAQASRLSLGRFRHLFASEMGISFKRYVLWRRMRMAAQALAAGASVTEAAHGAGFADSAHFSRTLRAMFGIQATALFRRASPK